MGRVWSNLKRGAVWPMVAAVMGCAAGAVDLDRDVLLGLKQEPQIHLVVYRSPVFTVATPGNSLVGSVPGVSGGALTMPFGTPGSNGGVYDPAVVVSEELGKALAFELGLTNLRPRPGAEPDDRPGALATSLGEGLVLDVKTLRWGMAPDPHLWTRYRVRYVARSRLIRLRDGRTVWQADCDASEREARSGSTLGELTAQDSAVLNDRLREAATRCSRDLTARFFVHLPAGPERSGD